MSEDKLQNDKGTSSIFGGVSMEFLNGLGNLMNRVGIAGFIVIMIVTFIFAFASEEQKHDIINAWILFQAPNSEVFFFIVVFVLTILLLIQRYFYKKEISLLNKRINEISGDKGIWQQNKIGKSLSTSKKSRK